MTTDQEIQKLHAVYCELSGRQMQYTARERYRWEYWYARRWTVDDLILVINFIKAKIKRGERRPESLRLYNLIEESRFEDDLQDARQQARKPVTTPKQQILKATGRPVEQQPAPAKTPAEIMADSTQMAAMLKQWRETNLK